ncbi:MAG: hypothetical protein LIV22_01510 [Olegusella sp.]|nr:hypothetical protein [Olegusella sp.]
MRRKLAACLAGDGLALLRMLLHAREQAAGDDDRRASPEEGEGMHMAAQPCILLHVQRRPGMGASAEWQGGHEEARLRHLAGHGVHELHRGPRPAGPGRPSRLVADPAHDIAPLGIFRISPAEPVIGHPWLAFGLQGVCMPAVQQPERHAGLPELPVDRIPVRIGTGAFGCIGPLREGPRTGLALFHAFCILPGDLLPLCRLGDSLDAVLRHPGRSRYRVAGCPCGQLLQHRPGPDLPCHAFLLRLAGTWQEEAISRRRGPPPGFSRRCRSAIWTVPKGNNLLSAGWCRGATAAVPVRANTHYMQDERVRYLLRY